MGDRKKWEYDGAVETGADRLLVSRRAEVIREYSLLRLHLTRFNWLSPETVGRAKSLVQRWVQGQVELAAADANVLRVKPERYLRNLLEILPRWASAPFASVITLYTVAAGKQLHLRIGALSELCESPDALVFKKLMSSETEEFTPDLVCTLVPLKKSKIQDVWLEWLKLDPEARLVRFWHWAGKSNPDKAIVDGITKHFKRQYVDTALAAATEPTVPSVADGDGEFDEVTEPDDDGRTESRSTGEDNATVAAARSFDDQLREFVNGLGIAVVDAVSWETLINLAQADRSKRQRILEALENGHWRWKLPFVEQGKLKPLQAGRSLSIVVLELMAAGAEKAVESLLTTRERQIKEIVEWTGSDLRNSLLVAVLNAVPKDDQKSLRSSKKLRRTAAEFLKKYHGDIKTDVMLVPRWKKLGEGPWRATLIESISGWKVTDFDVFLNSREVSEITWGKLSVELREVILTRWVKLAVGSKVLLETTARQLPDILQDAVRWGDFKPAIPYMLRSCTVKESITILSRLSSADRNAVVAHAAGELAQGVNHPVIEHWLVKDRKLLGHLLAARVDLFRTADISRFPLDDLLVAATRLRWFVPLIERGFDVQEVVEGLRRLARSRKLPSRKRAAVEVSSVLGLNHLPVLSFLSTRPVASVQGTRFDGMYHSWLLPKRKGGKREISAPKPYLKAIQRALLDALFCKVPLHDCVTGFRKDHSIKDNAVPHVGKPVVVNVDIAGFFPNTSLRIVRLAIARSVPSEFSRHARNLIFDVCTLKGGLPTGAPTSPAIANIGLVSFDHAIHKVCSRLGIAYTRYADDLTFSGADPGRVLPFIEECLEKLGYELDQKKTNFFRRGRRQIVTGLVVNDKVSLPKTMRRRLRAAVHNLGQKGDRDLHWHGKPMSASELMGRVAFLNSVDPGQGAVLLNRLKVASSDE